MLGFLFQLGLIFLSATSRQNKRHESRAEDLKAVIDEREGEIIAMKQRLEQFSAYSKQVLRKKDREGRAEVARLRKEEKRIRDDLSSQIRVLEREAVRMRGLDSEKIDQRVRELKGIHVAMQQKIARRDRAIEELEQKLAKQQAMATASNIISSAT